MNVVEIVSNKVWGGGERYVLDLAKAVRADGYNVGIISRNFTSVTEPFIRDGLLFATMKMRGFSGLIAPVKLASFLNKLEGATTVHVHNFKDAEIAVNARKLAKNAGQIRIVATRHLVKPAKTAKSRQKIYNELDAIIFVSRLAKDTFLSSHPEIDARRLHVVHNSVSMEPFDGIKPDGDIINFIYTGRISPEKGLDILVSALGQLKDKQWKLTVCGTGPGRTVMPIVRKARALEINDRIDWRGHVDDVCRELQGAHVAVMPSVCKESFGLAAIEAMSQECAVVATDNGAQTEFLTDGETALLVPPSDVDALAGALRRLIDDPGLRISLSANAKRYFAEKLSYGKFYDKTIGIIRENN